jgi:hypothetical protein
MHAYSIDRLLFISHANIWREGYQRKCLRLWARSFPNVQKIKNEQLLVVTKVLEKRDVLAKFPTGFGKFLTYQILPGVCEALANQTFLGTQWFLLEKQY